MKKVVAILTVSPFVCVLFFCTLISVSDCIYATYSCVVWTVGRLCIYIYIYHLEIETRRWHKPNITHGNDHICQHFYTLEDDFHSCLLVQFTSILEKRKKKKYCLNHPIPTKCISELKYCWNRTIPTKCISVLKYCWNRPIPTKCISVLKYCWNRPIPTKCISVLKYCWNRPIPTKCTSVLKYAYVKITHMFQFTNPSSYNYSVLNFIFVHTYFVCIIVLQSSA